MILDQNNVERLASIYKMNKFIPHLHIKFGLMKIFVKTTNKEGEGFEQLRQ